LTALIGQSTVAATVGRTVGNVKKGAVIAAHQIVIAYLMYYGGVDRADRGMSDFSVSFRCARWYMVCVFYCIDMALWNVWVIVRFKMEDKSEPRVYQDYQHGKHRIEGRFRMMLDLANELIALGTKLALEEVGGDRSRVRWLHRDPRFQERPSTAMPTVTSKCKRGYKDPSHDCFTNSMLKKPKKSRTCAGCQDNEPCGSKLGVNQVLWRSVALAATTPTAQAPATGGGGAAETPPQTIGKHWPPIGCLAAHIFWAWCALSQHFV
jgi:hypothetical protein